jgi:methionyl-tRNA synthetase
MKNKFYITTPLYYVNAAPHIGHSYTNIAVDCLARYHRQLGDKVYFLTGTDEHGQKIQQAALAQGLDTTAFVDRAVLVFKKLWDKLNISYDDFIRTTEQRHKRIVQRVLEILYKKGDIYEDIYRGWYCTPCETFWSESQIQEKKCPDCRRTVEKINEKNYFFKLSKYQNWLIDYINKHQDFIKPVSRREEVLRFLELNRLSDLCVSRPKERLTWGISLPFSPNHVTYVWFDALINYISAVGSFDKNDRYNSEWWPADLHVIGKDILRQHAIYWPIMLHALNIEPPKTIFAHGWWLIDERKMSKSRGNVVSPIEISDTYGVDVYRYFLLRDIPFGMDGNFSEDAIIKRLNGDLANDLGNLVYRTLTMIEKYFDGNIPHGNLKSEKAKQIEDKITSLDSRININMLRQDYNFSAALEPIWELINIANKYIEETKPWILMKQNKADELKEFILVLVRVIRTVAAVIFPFMPQTSEAIKQQIGKDRISKGKPLFPRIEK